MREFLKVNDLPTGFVAYTDQIAVGAMKVLHEKGYHVPRDVSIVGFNGDEFSLYSHPSLTTIVTPREELGKESVRRVIERCRSCKDSHTMSVKTILPVKLEVRDSCASSRKKL